MRPYPRVPGNPVSTMESLVGGTHLQRKQTFYNAGSLRPSSRTSPSVLRPSLSLSWGRARRVVTCLSRPSAPRPSRVLPHIVVRPDVGSGSGSGPR